MTERYISVGGHSSKRAPVKSNQVDTSQLGLVGGPNCGVCFLENTPVHSFLMFCCIVSIILAGDTLNNSTQSLFTLAKLKKLKTAMEENNMRAQRNQRFSHDMMPVITTATDLPHAIEAKCQPASPPVRPKPVANTSRMRTAISPAKP